MRRERVGGDGFAVLLAGFTALLASHRVEPDKNGSHFSSKMVVLTRLIP